MSGEGGPVVFIHGGWHGGWVWQGNVRLLYRAARDAFAPSLTGLGDRSHLLSPDISLSTHVTDIERVIESHDLRDVTLVGHSYGGLVAGQVADRMADRIARIVFLDSFVPVADQSVLDLSEGHGVRDAIEQAARDYGEGVYVPAPSAADFLEIRTEAAEWMQGRLTPQPLASYTEPTRLTGAWQTVGRMDYVAATAIATPMQRLRDQAMAIPGMHYHEIPCGHDVMIDMPDELHALLMAES